MRVFELVFAALRVGYDVVHFGAVWPPAIFPVEPYAACRVGALVDPLFERDGASLVADLAPLGGCSAIVGTLHAITSPA